MIEQNNDSKEGKATEGVLKSVLQHPTLPLTLLTALLYLFGRVHYEAYLAYWGLSESLFPISKDRSVIAGFFQSLLYSATIISKMGIVMIVILTVMIAVIISAYQPLTDKLKNSLSRFQFKVKPGLQDKFKYTLMHNQLINACSFIFNGYGLIIFMLIIIAYSCQWVSNQATEKARNDFQEIISGKEASSKRFSSRATLYVKNESKAFDTYSGYLIQASTTHAALYDKKKGMMILPQTNVSKMEIPENKTSAK